MRRSAFGHLASSGRRYRIVDLPGVLGEAADRLPWIHRILIENLLRRRGDPAPLADWLRQGHSDAEIAFHPGRVLMHDTTCGPALVDMAACRSALAEAGGDPARLNPVLPVDVSTDHSVAVDRFGTPDARAHNMARELERNGERYRFMKWATGAFRNLTVHPPGSGIMHTLNLERLASVVTTASVEGQAWAFPDTLIGTDSHTPMVGGLGVLAWGVGGLEAETVMFGLPVTLRAPRVVGVRLSGRLAEGALATDLALEVTALLRGEGIGGRFVEFFGPGVSTLSVGDRAVVANMAPEYGAATGYFPIDARTLAYLHATGRTTEHVALVGDYARRQGLWFQADAEPRYDAVVALDLAAVRPSLAGPRRPQDRLDPARTREAVGAGPTAAQVGDGPPDLAVAIAAITSCTNTSDPRLLVAAGLLARKARARSLAPPPWVKTSLAPGSPTAEAYLRRAGLLADLEALGFGVVAYGCTTCIGNSGPLPAAFEPAMAEGRRAVAVISGNRNFPGRVHPQLELGFLASPPMVVAFALAGDLDRDITTDAIGAGPDGAPVRLADLWPTGVEIDAALATAARPQDYVEAYDLAEASPAWAALQAPTGELYPWDPKSTYLCRPPFVTVDGAPRLGRYLARPLLVLGDDITTDHISPAGAVPSASEAAAYLIAHGEDPSDLNVFSARRGNWEAMVRGLFTNRTVRNLLAADIPAGRTIHSPSGEMLTLWAAAERYRAAGEAVVIVAGERYGMGSSRDWAAKGVALLGVRAVLASSFEAIHRSNLINMGVLPLLLPADAGPSDLALAPGDRIEVEAERLSPRGAVNLAIHYATGQVRRLAAMAAVETSLEADVLAGGGAIPRLLQRALRPA
ncbi:MAG: aconitate hydratase AcnA [Caulobacterales bacterium]|nr:aconitate hydratase AcnA [Caulobacterales bacterium]